MTLERKDLSTIFWRPTKIKSLSLIDDDDWLSAYYKIKKIQIYNIVKQVCGQQKVSVMFSLSHTNPDIQH